MIYMDTWATKCRLDLVGGGDMLMPGDQATIRITLSDDMPILAGQKFTIRDNNETVATGIVTRLCDSIEVLDKTKLQKLNIIL